MERGLLRTSVVLTALLALGCASPKGSPPAPGYHGPYPSGPAQAVLKGLKGQRLRGAGGELAGGDLIVIGFAVAPNPVTGKGPVMVLQREDSPEKPMPLSAPQGTRGYYWLPVLTDGDAADLHQRVTGRPHPELSGELSSEYKKTLGLR
jgi:hypothetical protein